MTAKHSPATPLPWSFNHNSVSKEERIIPHADGYGAIGSAFKPDNAAFIVHAANAYPRLVEALRETLGMEDKDRRPTWKQDAEKEARALLRSLGEAE